MGFFDDSPYDLDDDMDEFVGMQLISGSRREAIDLTGDDTFYVGDDDPDDSDDWE